MREALLQTASPAGNGNRPLPEAWKGVRLGDVCIPAGTRDPRKTPDDNFKYVDISSVDNCRKQIVEARIIRGSEAPSRARQIIRSGDILVATTRPNLNAVAVVPENLDGEIASTGFCVLRPSAALNSEYLFSFVRTASFAAELSDLVKGALYPAVTDAQVRARLLPLPPLAEQKRIAGALGQQLERVERARTAAEAQLVAAELTRHSFLREIFAAAEANSWPINRIADISSLVIDGPHVTPDYVSKGIPFLTVRNIVTRSIDLGDVSYVSEADHQSFRKRGKGEVGDILYTKDGTLGVPCVVRSDFEFSFFVSVALIKLNKSVVDPDFVALALESPRALEQVKNLGAGAGLKHMVLKSIRALEVPVPPLTTQSEIVARWEVIHDRLAATTASIEGQLQTLNQLQPALLRTAFAGGT